MDYYLSTTCVGKVSGKPLMSYDSQAAAEYGAEHARQRYGNRMVSYHCENCDNWHLAPADRQTPGDYNCGCVGRDGQPKRAYESYDDAERRAEILRDERWTSLKVYPCPRGGGWHLSKG